MRIEAIQNFLTLPELPDIISYIIIVAVFICEYFLKKFIQKDNKLTILKVKDKTEKLDELINKYEKEKEALREERKQIRKEFNMIKNAIKISVNNSHDLVSNGMAHEISKMLNDEEQNSEVNKDDE